MSISTYVKAINSYLLREMKEIYIPIFRGSLRVVYQDRLIHSVEYIDRVEDKSYNDIVSLLFKRYASGLKTDFTQLKIKLDGLTDFQIRVYRVVRRIPYGEVRSYKWVAEQLGIKSPRAIGQALKRNPFLIVVPCHRVIKSNGDLGGFTSIHGTNLKKHLLRLEGVDI